MRIAPQGGSARTARNRRRRQRRRARMAGGSAGTAYVAPVVQQAVMRGAEGGRRGRRRRARGGNVNSDGSTVVERREMIVEIKAKSQGAFDLDPKNFSWLKTVSAAYERCEWQMASIFYKPAVGTNVSGLVVYGIDWNSNAPAAPDRTKVLAYTPVSDHPVWQDASTQPLVLAASKLQSRKEYLLDSTNKVDVQPGQLVYNCTNTDATSLLGELWIHYRIRFFGTQA